MSAPSLAQEREWLRLAQHHRDPQAFGQLVALHQGRVRAVLRKLTRGQQALADELAQETFIKAWRALPTFRHGAQWSTWLHRIAYLEFLQHQRRNGHEHANTTSPEHEAIASTQPAHDLRLDLEKALAQLHPLENAAIVYCYHGGLSHAEAAQVLDLPLGTVKSHVLRGRVLPGGADRQLLRPDGIKELDALYEMQHEDGTVLTVHNRVTIDDAPTEGPRYAFSHVKITAPEGPHAWLNRRVFVGTLHGLLPERQAVLIRVWLLR